MALSSPLLYTRVNQYVIEYATIRHEGLLEGMAPCKHRNLTLVRMVILVPLYAVYGQFFFVYSYFLCILIAHAPWYIEVFSAKLRTSHGVFYRLQVHVIDISPYQQPVIDALTLTSVQLDMHSRDQVEDT